MNNGSCKECLVKDWGNFISDCIEEEEMPRQIRKFFDLIHDLGMYRIMNKGCFLGGNPNELKDITLDDMEYFCDEEIERWINE